MGRNKWNKSPWKRWMKLSFGTVWMFRTLDWGPPIFKGKEVRSCKAQWVALELPSVKKVKHKINVFFLRSEVGHDDHESIMLFWPDFLSVSRQSTIMNTRLHQSSTTKIKWNQHFFVSPLLPPVRICICPSMFSLEWAHMRSSLLVNGWWKEGYSELEIWLHMVFLDLFGGSLVFLISTLSLVNWFVW